MIKLVRALVIATSWFLFNISDAVSQEMPVLFLDGNSSVELPQNLFHGTTEATIEVWVKWNRFNRWSRVFDFGREENAMVLQNENTSNRLNYRIWNRSSRQYGIQSRERINTGVWYHIATVSGPGGMKFYINGQLVDEDDYTGSLSEVAGGRNFVGKSNWSGDELFEGYISELRIWSRRRSQAEINSSMRSALSGQEDGLLAYYRFTDVDDDQVPNLVDINTSATMIGAARLVNVPAIASTLVPTEDDRRAETHYERARAAFRAQEFDVVISELQELARIYPTYKDANRLYSKADSILARASSPADSLRKARADSVLERAIARANRILAQARVDSISVTRADSVLERAIARADRIIRQALADSILTQARVNSILVARADSILTQATARADSILTQALADSILTQARANSILVARADSVLEQGRAHADRIRKALYKRIKPDEPSPSPLKWIIVAGAVLALLILFGWFMFVQRKKAQVPQPAPFRCLLEGREDTGQTFVFNIPALALSSGATLGRSPTNSEFIIDHEAVSREHIRLLYADGNLYAEDLGSTNGTRINGRSLNPREPIVLQNNDQLELGPVVFRARLMQE